MDGHTFRYGDCQTCGCTYGQWVTATTPEQPYTCEEHRQRERVRKTGQLSLDLT